MRRISDLSKLGEDYWLAGLVDLDAGDLANLRKSAGMVFMLMVPKPPRDWRLYSSKSVRLP
jgi:hypothetical protein